MEIESKRYHVYHIIRIDKVRVYDRLQKWFLHFLWHFFLLYWICLWNVFFIILLHTCNMKIIKHKCKTDGRRAVGVGIGLRKWISAPFFNLFLCFAEIQKEAVFLVVCIRGRCGWWATTKWILPRMSWRVTRIFKVRKKLWKIEDSDLWYPKSLIKPSHALHSRNTFAYSESYAEGCQAKEATNCYRGMFDGYLNAV